MSGGAAYSGGLIAYVVRVEDEPSLFAVVFLYKFLDLSKVHRIAVSVIGAEEIQIDRIDIETWVDSTYAVELSSKVIFGWQ